MKARLQPRFRSAANGRPLSLVAACCVVCPQLKGDPGGMDAKLPSLIVEECNGHCPSDGQEPAGRGSSNQG